MDKCLITNLPTALFIYLQIPTNYMTGVWKRKVND